MKRLRTKKMMEKENLYIYIYIHRLGPIMHQASKTQPLEALETNLAYLDRVPLV